ncbi:hypothetical protein LCGC14_0388680 [marine sediment metagenome]|uniref:Uncharacterized protein n=1 Tax=marine sediment metagenome TaxID=412755 RepID=A0A0F9VME5_9ZZZZ
MRTFRAINYLHRATMSTRDSVGKYKECSTTLWMCLFEENYEFVLVYQAKMKAKKKRANLPEVINAIISELKENESQH